MNSKEMSEVLDRVQTWDMEMHIDLARKILETVALSRPPKSAQKMSLDEIVGILKTDAIGVNLRIICLVGGVFNPD